MKKMKSLSLIILLLSVSSNVFADGLDNLRQSEGFGDLFGGDGGGSTDTYSDTPITADSSSSASVACSKEDQKTIPYKKFLGLMGNAKLDVSHNANNGILSLKSQKMISNCNKMLKYNFTSPRANKPYLFSVEVAKPSSGCKEVEVGEGAAKKKIVKCSYEYDVSATNKTDGERTNTLVHDFEPNYNGFMACLKKANVFDENDKLVPNNVVIFPFDYEQAKVKSTDEVAFYSRGPQSKNLGAVYGETEHKGGRCDVFEKITKNGFTAYSRKDIEAQERELEDARILEEKQHLFDKICSQNDYQLIEKYLPTFSGLDAMTSILREVRNKYLLADVRALHKELAKKKSYEKLDVEKYKRVIADFYNKIIKPLKNKIANLQDELDAGPADAERKIIQKELDAATKELLGYAKGNYLTIKDKELMQDFAKKAPLEEADWRDAIVDLTEIHSTADNYYRYNSKSKQEILDIEETEELITYDVEDEREFVENLGSLASDTEYSIGDEYVQVANNYSGIIEDSVKDYYQYHAELSARYRECGTKMRFYPAQRSVANCQKRTMTEIQEHSFYGQQRLQNINNHFSPLISLQHSEAQRWYGIEKQRDLAYGVQSEVSLPGGPTPFNFPVAQTGNIVPRATGLIFEGDQPSGYNPQIGNFNYGPGQQRSNGYQAQVSAGYNINNSFGDFGQHSTSFRTPSSSYYSGSNGQFGNSFNGQYSTNFGNQYGNTFSPGVQAPGQQGSFIYQ